MKAAFAICAVMLALLSIESEALECHSFTENTLSGLTNATASEECDESKTTCLSVQYTAILQSDGSQVKFQQGTCSTINTCHKFCSTVKADSRITARIPQCQAQCCSSDGCNKKLL